MFKPLLLVFFLLPLFTWSQNDFKPLVLDYTTLAPMLEKNNDTIYLINFWATWCKPCIEELPFFEQVRQDQFPTPVQVILVSLDFRNQLDSKLIPFLKENKIKSKVVVLDDSDANSWIDKIDPRWSGALPATIVYKNEDKRFFPDGFQSYEAVKEVLVSF
ncbi:MAG: TlpA family protein disulfide reductase [Saprospiraceae bacterium]|nr:TlpA family protein disulfide reductase [Saprospiraceae bacterium]